MNDAKAAGARALAVRTFTTNVASKLVAASSGGRAYGLRVGAGLAASTAALWAPWLFGWSA